MYHSLTNSFICFIIHLFLHFLIFFSLSLVFSSVGLLPYNRLAYENAKDIIACGFDMKKTFMFTDLDYIQHMYPTILKIQKFTTYSQVRFILYILLYFLKIISSLYISIILTCSADWLYQVRAIFGFVPGDNIGKSAFPAVQACPAFPSTFHIPLKGSLDMPCLIPCAIDQVTDSRCIM